MDKKKGGVEVIKAVKVEDRNQRALFEKIWTEVWKEKGYDDGKSEKTLTYYRKYDCLSEDFIFYFEEVAFGTVRYILKNQEIKLPIVEDFGIDETDIDGEVTLLTVIKCYRGKLYLKSTQLAIEKAIELKMERAGISVDEKLWKMYQRIGVLEKSFPEKGRVYQGSLTIPAIITRQRSEKLIKRT